MPSPETNNPGVELLSKRNYHQGNWLLPTPVQGALIQAVYTEAVADVRYHQDANLANQFRQLFIDEGGQVFFSLALEHYSRAISKTRDHLLLGFLHMDMAMLFMEDSEVNGTGEQHIHNSLWIAREHAELGDGGLIRRRAKRELLKEIRQNERAYGIGEPTETYETGFVLNAMPTAELNLGALAVEAVVEPAEEVVGWWEPLSNREWIEPLPLPEKPRHLPEFPEIHMVPALEAVSD